MIAVGAVNGAGRRANFSQVGDTLLYAPGVGGWVDQTDPAKKHYSSGTSYSSAIFAGVAAYVLSEMSTRRGCIQETWVEQRLTSKSLLTELPYPRVMGGQKVVYNGVWALSPQMLQ